MLGIAVSSVFRGGLSSHHRPSRRVFSGGARIGAGASAFACAIISATTSVSGITITQLDGRRSQPQQSQQQQSYYSQYFSSQQHPQQQQQQKANDYGTKFEPQDIAYEKQTKEALTSIRNLNRDDVDNNETHHLSSILQKSGNKVAATLTLIGYKGGPLDKQINQDRSFVISPYHLVTSESEASKDSSGQQQHTTTPNRKLLGVFDGHAPLGENVSQHCVNELPKLFANKLINREESSQNKDNDNKANDDETEAITQILEEVFIELDKTAPANISGGCTATIIYQENSKIYIANAGDSSSFIVVYRSKSKQTDIVYLSREDKPNLPDERKRVEAMGGQVYIPLAGGTSRVLYIDTDTGTQSGLAMSRSIGDWAAGNLGVIPDPIVGVIDINELIQNEKSKKDDDDDDIHIFAVSATDGMMDYCSAEAISKVLATSLYEDNGPHLLTAIEQLIYYAAQGWFQTRLGTYRDDIAIAVCSLRSPNNNHE